MKKIRKLLFTFLITLFIFNLIPKETQSTPMDMLPTFKQGIYDISEYAGYVGKAKLITPGKYVTIIVIGPNGMQKNFTMLNSSKEEVMGALAIKGDKMIIIGPGEVAISAIKLE